MLHNRFRWDSRIHTSGAARIAADAGHMLSDVAALGLSLFALWIAARPRDNRRTYGYYRAEILAALVNGAVLIAISCWVFIEAYYRFANPPAVLGKWMMLIAIGGLAVNLAGMWLLHGGQDNLNVRAAWLHVLGDTLGSVGAIIAGLLIWAWDWKWADPLLSVLIGLLVIYSSWRLLSESVSVLMESVPARLQLDEIEHAMLEIPGVREVHDLHVWSITSGLESLSAHVVVQPEHSRDEVLTAIRAQLHERFSIDHQTIQLEPQEFEEQRSAF